jgi:uncharacterized protein (TIGR02118 family)
MNVRMGLLRKKHEWTDERFRDYWRNTHGPLAVRVLNLREYWQNIVTDRLQRGIDFARGQWDFDGISQLWFDEMKNAGRAFHDDSMAATLAEDEGRFLDVLHIVMTRQDIVIPVPEDAARARLLKRISTLKRRPDISEDDFRREWIVHRDLVRKMPGVSAYRQNVVLSRERVKGIPCSYQDLPIDGIVELWFETTDTLNAAFASPAGQTAMAHAKTFLFEITAFVVVEHRIV